MTPAFLFMRRPTIGRLALPRDWIEDQIMKVVLGLVLAAICGLVVVAAVKGLPGLTSARGVADLQAEHVSHNAPRPTRFNAALQRDLEAHFAGQGHSGASVTYQLLRDGPTQTGIAWPKYYLWVEVESADAGFLAGAARVAAIEGEGFLITRFVSKQEIVAAPDRLSGIFPTALVPDIRARAHRP